MIQTRKHSPAIDSFLLGSTREMFVDLENELVLTHSQLLVSLIWKITSFMCGGEHLKSMFTIYDLYVWEICKTQRKHTSWFVRYIKCFRFFFLLTKRVIHELPSVRAVYHFMCLLYHQAWWLPTVKTWQQWRNHCIKPFLIKINCHRLL